MKLKLTLSALTLGLASLSAQAQTEVQWWHSMGGALGEWVNDLAKDFNNSQKDYKIVPTFKGSYDESMTAAIAAFSSAPQVLLASAQRSVAVRLGATLDNTWRLLTGPGGGLQAQPLPDGAPLAVPGAPRTAQP